MHQHEVETCCVDGAVRPERIPAIRTGRSDRRGQLLLAYQQDDRAIDGVGLSDNRCKAVVNIDRHGRVAQPHSMHRFGQVRRRHWHLHTLGWSGAANHVPCPGQTHGDAAVVARTRLERLSRRGGYAAGGARPPLTSSGQPEWRRRNVRGGCTDASAVARTRRRLLGHDGGCSDTTAVARTRRRLLGHDGGCSDTTAVARTRRRLLGRHGGAKDATWAPRTIMRPGWAARGFRSAPNVDAGAVTGGGFEVTLPDEAYFSGCPLTGSCFRAALARSAGSGARVGNDL